MILWIYKSFIIPSYKVCYNVYRNQEEVSIMEKFIPYEKLSKKEKRKIDQARRQTWGELNPVTRKPMNSKAYNRKRTQDWKKEIPNLASLVIVPVI